ncbi:MAG: HIT family protein [Minisyncoccota bacterium]
MNATCLFCKIISGDVPAANVYEDEHSLAFLDIHPINPGHILLVPKAHLENLSAMPDELLARMAPVIKKLALAAKSAVGADGINIGMNNDSAAGQVIFHAHIHIIPRFTNDGLIHWHGARDYAEDEMANVATQIRVKLG